MSRLRSPTSNVTTVFLTLGPDLPQTMPRWWLADSALQEGNNVTLAMSSLLPVRDRPRAHGHADERKRKKTAMNSEVAGVDVGAMRTASCKQSGIPREASEP